MALINSKNYFLALSVIAVFLLWGVSLWNGTVKELFVASWEGKFEDGTFFETNYTGIFILDFPISLLVAFFFFGTNGHDRGYQYFLIDAYSTLQSAFVWLYVESGREAAKPFPLANPIIWGLVWQAFGAAISLPLFFYLHLTWTYEQADGLAGVSVPIAKSIPISFAMGAVLSAIIGMLPTWIHRSSSSHQYILAFWQLDPVWVSLVQALGVVIFRWLTLEEVAKSTRGSLFWVRTAYVVAVISSATGHLYVLSQLSLNTSNPALSWTRLYVPMVFTHPASQLRLVNGPWLFLQYDLIIIGLSSVSWAFILLSRLTSGHQYWKTAKLVALFLVGTAILGPGATVSLALFWREGELLKIRASQESSSSSGRLRK